jgi:hypothetical protein
MRLFALTLTLIVLVALVCEFVLSVGDTDDEAWWVRTVVSGGGFLTVLWLAMWVGVFAR